MGTPRLQEKYSSQVTQKLRDELGIKNVMEIPRLEKVVLNMGLGEAVQNSKVVDAAASQLTSIAGQKAVVTRARKSIAGFKLREGMPIGAMVTLRRDRMWEFVDRLFNFALPRVRDFRGVSAKAFDGRGNYTLGIKEQIVFPEVEYDKVDHVRGLNVTFVIRSQSDEHSKALLGQLGMPFRK